jgi:hypothetical protein
MLTENQNSIALEALRHTEMRLESLNGLAVLAETKAMQFATIVTAFTTILAINAKNFPNPAMTYFSAALLIGVALLSMKTAFPKNFHITGHYWREWESHFADNDEFVSVVISQAKENDLRIDYNEQKLEEIADNFKFAFRMLIFAIIFFTCSQINFRFN